LIGISKIVRDITERLSLEAQFRQAQKMEAVGRLAGGVAHDFNNLLGIISGYCGLLLEEAPAGHPMRAYLVEIERAGQRAASLTRQLLAYGRKQFLAPEVINLNAVVIDCEKMLRRLLGEDIELATVSAPDKGWARVDVGQLEQALMNMAINARDAMPQGGKLTIETAPVMLDETYCQSRGDLKPGPHVMLAMTDSGSGMDAQTKAHIFEPFFTTKEVGKGSGLGLAMVFGFVQQSGGHIAVYSEPGLGSAFKLYFPAVAPACPVQKPAPVAEMALPGSETILLVEDELDLRKLTRQILSQHGYTVLEAGNGGEAVQLAASHAGRIDLLLSDVVMPVMGGRQLAAQLEALRPAIKVLFMSGYTDDAVMRHGVLASETAYIQKPFTVESLPLKVRKVLDEPGKPAGVTPAP
jgi:nitrogen-specific signal transduction histidine kinase/ActR/RegA family two-component response regulator